MHAVARAVDIATGDALVRLDDVEAVLEPGGARGARQVLPRWNGSTRTTRRAPQPSQLRAIKVTSTPARSSAGSARATKRSAPP
jgi:hypothetical protein